MNQPTLQWVLWEYKMLQSWKKKSEKRDVHNKLAIAERRYQTALQSYKIFKNDNR